MKRRKIDPNLSLSEKRAIAGSWGGKKTVKLYGKRYMRKLAKYAAHRLHSTYRLEPVLLNDFALVNRQTNEIKALLSGRPVPIDLKIVYRKAEGTEALWH